MTDRLHDLFKGLSGAAALLLLLAAPPLALVAAVGWPLPRTLPSWDEVSDALGGSSVSDAVLLKALACCCWVVWALFLISVVHEILAWARGRAASALPAAGGVQPVARRLVMAATLLFALSRTTAPAVSLPALEPAMATAAANRAPVPTVVEAQVAPAAPAAPALPSCVVQPRDSLWRLAERHLGDGLRWREIWELNQGIMHPDGRTFTDPNLIHPGWQLTMPANSVGLPQPTVEPPEPAPVSLPPPPSTTVPSTTAPPPTTEAAPTTTIDAAAATVRADASDRHSVTEDDPDHDVVPLLAGAALVAAGVVLSIDRQRRRRAGRPGRSTPADLRPTEVSLRRAADERAYTRVDLALRNLAHQLSLDGDIPPSVDVVSVGPSGVEIVLDHPSAAPDGPFVVVAEGQAWTLPPTLDDADLRPVASSVAGPTPALAAVGTVDDRSVLVDLEAVPCTVVNGDPKDAVELLWTIVLDLATSDRADDVDIFVVGDVPSGLDRLDRVRHVPTLAALLPELERLAARTTQDLRSMGTPTPYVARVRGLGDGLAPAVVVISDDRSPELAAVVEIARRQGGVSLLVAGDAVAGERELCVEDDTLVVKPLGLRLTPGGLPSEVTVRGAALVADAANEDELDLRDEPAVVSVQADQLEPMPDEFVLVHDEDGSPVVPEGHVVVRVLGGVEIFGGDRRIDRRRSVELVVYLAMHPGGVDEEQIREALWPEQEPTRSAFNETISRARRSLGLDPTGEHHVRHCERGRYRLGPYVHLEARRSAGADGQLALPFRGCSGYEWAYTEGLAYSLESMARSEASR